MSTTFVALHCFSNHWFSFFFFILFCNLLFSQLPLVFHIIREVVFFLLQELFGLFCILCASTNIRLSRKFWGWLIIKLLVHTTRGYLSSWPRRSWSILSSIQLAIWTDVRHTWNIVVWDGGVAKFKVVDGTIKNVWAHFLLGRLMLYNGSSLSNNLWCLLFGSTAFVDGENICVNLGMHSLVDKVIGGSTLSLLLENTSLNQLIKGITLVFGGSLCLALCFLVWLLLLPQHYRFRLPH